MKKKSPLVGLEMVKCFQSFRHLANSKDLIELRRQENWFQMVLNKTVFISHLFNIVKYF